MDNNPRPNYTPKTDNEPIKSDAAASTQPTQNQSPLPRNGMRVIQPISSDLTPSSATPNIPTSAPLSGATPNLEQVQTPIQAVPPTPATNATFNSPPARPATSSIYPNAMQSVAPTFTSTSTTKHTSNLAGQSEKTKIIIACIWLIGAFIAIPAALSLFGVAKTLSYGVGGGKGGLITVIDVVDILVGVGIIFRKEMARVVYVVLAIIGLVLSLYGTFNYIKQLHTYSQLASQAMMSTQKQITQQQNNTSLPAAERREVVQNLQQVLAQEKEEQNPTLGIPNLILDYLIALVPFVFLTRPSVKEQFE